MVSLSTLISAVTIPVAMTAEGNLFFASSFPSSSKR